MKKLYNAKISKRDRELHAAFAAGISCACGVEAEYEQESAAFFTIKWAKENHITIPEFYKELEGKWNWDVGHVVAPNTDFNLTPPVDGAS
jgi:hypothetical protein